ncbi:MAG: hypothetical protein AAGD25_04995 [Cyanobacteria bacterium P01_F01_bin.150]
MKKSIKKITKLSESNFLNLDNSPNLFKENIYLYLTIVSASCLSIFLPSILLFLFKHNFDCDRYAKITLDANYKFASILGNICIIIIFFRNKKIAKETIRNLRKILFGLLSLITLISFSKLSFSSYMEGNFIDKSSSFHISIFFVFSELSLLIVIWKLEFLFALKSKKKDNLVSNQHNFLPVQENLFRLPFKVGSFFCYKYILMILNIFLNMMKNIEKNKFQKRTEEVIEMFQYIVINFIISMIPFLIDLFLSFSLSNIKPLGRIVGLNDLYLIPAAFGAVEVASQISSNNELKTEATRFMKRFLIFAVWMVSLISFSLFAFGCNEKAYEDMNEPFVYAIVGSLYCIIAVLIVALKSLAIREIE